jgi:hypothetical protein
MNRLITWRRSAVTAALAGVLCMAMGVYLSRSESIFAAPAIDDKPSNKFVFLAHESFDEKLHLDWQPVRPDVDHVSLTKNPAKLTITTQQGTIHGDEKAAGEPSAKNIYVMPNPLAKDADFVITTSISDFYTDREVSAGRPDMLRRR